MTDHALDRPRRTSAKTVTRDAPSWSKLAWRQYRLERRMFWRNPTAAFFNAGVPLLFLVLFGVVFAGDRGQLEVLVPGIAAMSVMTTTFNALAHNVVSLRERGILKRMRGTPLPSSAYLAALAGHALTNTVVQVLLVTAAGRFVFGLEWPRDWLALGVFVAAGAACFAALGVALAHLIPHAESAPAYVNAIFLPVIGVSGVFYDEAEAPAIIADVAQVLPLTHLVDGLAGAWVDGTGLAVHWGALVVVLAWGALAAFPAIRGFSWESRRS
jgi:ABC-2 type transport system permease protein